MRLARRLSSTPIRNLVLQVSGGIQTFGSPLVHLSRQISIRDGYQAAISPMGKRGAVFDCQGVQGKMVRSQAQGQIQSMLPGFQSLFRQAEDQIQIDIVQAGLTGPLYALYYLAEIMLAFKQTQLQWIR